MSLNMLRSDGGSSILYDTRNICCICNIHTLASPCGTFECGDLIILNSCFSSCIYMSDDDVMSYFEIKRKTFLFIPLSVCHFSRNSLLI